MKLAVLNHADDDAAEAMLLACCGSSSWARAMAEGRPYADFASLVAAARREWHAVDDSDRLEAFGAHPLIGDPKVLRDRFNARAQHEQGQVAAASDAVLERLAGLNRDYAEKFGFIFIVCATGKTADEMLGLLEARIDNPRAAEIANAAREQAAITELRLARDFAED